jgi:hypothetical protein
MNTTPNAVGPPDALTRALTIALDDEYRARATYAGVIQAFGAVAPFDRIVQSEERHVAALEAAFARRGLPLPANRWQAGVPAPASLAQACRDGVAGEIHNIALYDGLLPQVTAPDVRAVFTNLRNASADAHLPAFQACAARYGAAEAPASSGVASPWASLPAWAPLAAGLAAGAGLALLAARA